MKFVTAAFFFILLTRVSLFAGGEQDFFNKGKSLYDSGRYEEAAEVFLDLKDRETGYYNAARSLEEDFRSAKNQESLNRAIEAYYRVLDYDPLHGQAIQNLEQLRMLQEELMSQQDSQNETGEGSGEDPSRDKEADSASGDGEQDPSGDGNSESGLDDLARRQRELSRSSSTDAQKEQEQLRDETAKALASEENRNAADSLQKALDMQRKALEQMQEGKGDAASRAQSLAADALEDAASGGESPGEEDPLPAEIRNLLNRDQRRNETSPSDDDMFVERNW